MSQQTASILRHQVDARHVAVPAGQGRAVLVSKYRPEMAPMAEDLVVIGRGRLIAHETATDFIARLTTRA